MLAKYLRWNEKYRLGNILFYVNELKPKKDKFNQLIKTFNVHWIKSDFKLNYLVSRLKDN